MSQAEPVRRVPTPAPGPDPYAALAAAEDGAARARLLLRLSAAVAPQPLALPAAEGQAALLDEIDLSPAALEEQLGGDDRQPVPTWWDAENRRVALRGADLRGASLRQANLEQADLTGSHLAAAALGGARLRGATLEEADLTRADLASADLNGAALGSANLDGALLEDADLQEASLRFARLQGSFLEGANLQGADLWSARLAGANLAGANLKGCVLNEADLSGADLSGATLQNAVLNGASLKAARLTGADLRDADLTGARLSRAHLQRARLDGLDLTRTEIAHVFLQGATLQRAQFSREQLGGAIGEERTRAFEEARQGYLALERHFLDLGDPDDARWAYRKRRRMQKRATHVRARLEWDAGRPRRAVAQWAVYAGDQLVEWICDYGESIGRVLSSILAVYATFTLIYGLSGSVVRIVGSARGAHHVPTHRALDLAVFSLLAMTTQGSPVGLLPRNETVQFLTGIEALLGIGLTGLLGFVIGNRIRR